MSSYDIPRLLKQPNERRVYTFDFSKNMTEDEAIAMINSFTASPSGLTIDQIVASGKQAQARIAGGASGTTYKITVQITTDSAAANILEGEANLFVRDI